MYPLGTYFFIKVLVYYCICVSIWTELRWTKCAGIDLYHGIDALLKFDQTQKTKHTTGKSKPKLVSEPIVRVVHQSIAKRHHFRKFNFCKVIRQTGKHCPFRSFAIEIKTTIFKLMALRNTSGSESARKLAHLLILICSCQCCVLFLCLDKLYRSSPIRGKGLYYKKCVCSALSMLLSSS